MYFDQIKLESKDYPISRTVLLPEECTLAFLHWLKAQARKRGGKRRSGNER